MPRVLFILLLAVLFPIHLVLLERASYEQRHLTVVETAPYTLPAPILKICSLGFDGLVSDYLYLKSLVFIGSTFERTGEIMVKDQEWKTIVKDREWKWLYGMLDVSTDLDPYFRDPYIFANSNLTWKAGMIRETNTLLEKGSRNRDWDWALPFFIGFNYFYFLQDNEKASEHLMQAYRRPGASPMYADLAAKLAYKGRKTENAILFLEEILRKTDDENFKKEFKTRLETLRDILYLEKAVDTYKQKFGRIPGSLDVLIKKGIIREIPKDPYNREFYVDLQGAVKTTNDNSLLPYHH